MGGDRATVATKPRIYISWSDLLSSALTDPSKTRINFENKNQLFQSLF